jgi:beta-lactam-binding protein with PASTA domain
VFKFITNRPFWVNLLVAISVAVGVFFLTLQMLGVITNNGKYLKVPSVVGKKTTEAIKLLESQGFEVLIQDSIYTDTATKGIVLKQIPEATSTVKINRTVILTVNRVTLPLVDMPALQGKSINFALEMLRRSHLKLGDTIFKPDFMRGSVLDQLFRGNIISSGTKLPWGSYVDLVVGGGLQEEAILVPDLVGMTYNQAKMILDENGIILGALVTDDNVSDTASAYIWKQLPPKYNEQNQPVYIQPGQLIDLWLTVDTKTPIDSLKKIE